MYCMDIYGCKNYVGMKAELDLNHVHNSRTPLLTDGRKLMENRRGPKAMTTPCRRSPPW